MQVLLVSGPPALLGTGATPAQPTQTPLSKWTTLHTPASCPLLPSQPSQAATHSMAPSRITQAATAAATMVAPMRMTTGTTASSSRHRSTRLHHTSHMASPRLTATTVLPASSTLLPLARPRTMLARMGSSRHPRRPSSTHSRLSRRSRHTSRPACQTGSSFRQTMARLTITMLPRASPSGRGQQGLHEGCLLMHKPTSSSLHLRRCSRKVCMHYNASAWVSVQAVHV